MRFFVPELKSVIVAITILPARSFCVSYERGLWGDRISHSSRSNRRRIHLYSSLRRNISAAEQERREEDKRRRERVEDVVPGKTSAINGATDYSIDIDSTREQFLRQATQLEQEIYRTTELGMEMLRMLRLDDASKAFDRVFELKPDAYLWQAGIVKFYLGDLDRAEEIFSLCASIFETRFDELASEERIWVNASLLKKLMTINRKDRKNLLAQKDDADAGITVLTNSNSCSSTKIEKRKVVRLALELFQSSVDEDLTSTVISRAKLRSIGGAFNDLLPTMDKKLWKISSWYYLGLHYDALGDFHASKMCMKAALRLCPSANSEDLIYTLPMLHMSCRNWFDDEDFDIGLVEDQVESDVQKGGLIVGPCAVDPVLGNSLRLSLEKTRLVDLQKALRKRGLRVIGSKLELQKRLYESLIDDTELLIS